MQHKVRRTGAGMFIGSGAVRDDPAVFLQADIYRVEFNQRQRNVHRILDMSRVIYFHAAHIEDDRFTFIECGFCVFRRNTRDIILARWEACQSGQNCCWRGETRQGRRDFDKSRYRVAGKRGTGNNNREGNFPHEHGSPGAFQAPGRSDYNSQ